MSVILPAQLACIFHRWIILLYIEMNSFSPTQPLLSAGHIFQEHYLLQHQGELLRGAQCTEFTTQHIQSMGESRVS